MLLPQVDYLSETSPAELKCAVRWLKHLKEVCDPVGWYFDAEGNFELLLSLQCPTSPHHKGFGALIKTHCCCCCCEQVNHEPQTVTSNRTLRKQKAADPNIWRALYITIDTIICICSFYSKCTRWHHTRLCLKLDITVARKEGEEGRKGRKPK